VRFTDRNFKQEVLNSELPVLVDFWGSWCPPCKMVEPVIDELASQLNGIIKVGKLNVDQNPATRSTFEVSAAPTFILFKNGQVVQRIIGACAKKQLLRMIETSSGFQEPKQAIKTISNPETPKHEPTDMPKEVRY